MRRKVQAVSDPGLLAVKKLFDSWRVIKKAAN
jgi:hypothetical protein